MILLQLLVAVFIATGVYRWQKQVDRETAVLAEVRKLCAEYTSACKRAYLEQPFKDDPASGERIDRFFAISAQEQELYVLRDQLYLIAPKEILAFVDEHDRAFREWKIGFPKPDETNQEIVESSRRHDEALRRSYREMLESFRRWLQAHSDQTSWLPENLRQKLQRRRAQL